MTQVMVFGGNFCPRGWTNTDGQLLPINSNQALFSLIGCTYGGDCRSTFALPDLRGRVAVHVGTNPGINNVGSQGAKGGTNYFTMTRSTMPSHKHTFVASSVASNTANPSSNILGRGNFYHVDDAANTVSMDPRMIENTGGSLEVNKNSPYQVIRYCIATQGTFCSRN
ncbi:hypothetical protein AB838_19350 [Rhodobacteraceae bacterium (ex Bugula neritina AB1)]|nr:hypothetical protein AB838_19350 [Rhodobacteraceae bacterium (ex Bugula neritina AB1)]